ncbi:MAG: TadE/TadG family type IV pilus assembly protein [Actinomycetota bacterium]
MKSLRKRTDTLTSERGAAAVEFALIATVLVMLLFGILEYGRLFGELEVLESAAREGARAASVHCGNAEGCTAADIQTAVTTAAAGYALDAVPTADLDCSDPANFGKPVAVGWAQTFDLDIPFVTLPTITRSISGVFRCE